MTSAKAALEARPTEELSERAEVVHGEVVAYQPATLNVVPTATALELVARLATIKQAMEQAMQKDVDYGVIPGTGTKPTLLKPGAEKLGALFQLDVQLANEKIWHDDGHLTVISHATVYHQPTGTRLGGGEGICTTRESKYGWRQESRKCPVCGVAAIIKGKEEYGGGWLCFKKKDGCGAKFRDDDETITGQATGRVPNPDLPDTYNTVDKMASKRARIDAVLAVTGASALFTQDVEEFAQAEEQTPAPQPTAARRTASKPKSTPAPVPATAEEIEAYKAELLAAGFEWNGLPEGVSSDEVARFRTGLAAHVAQKAAEAAP